MHYCKLIALLLYNRTSVTNFIAVNMFKKKNVNTSREKKKTGQF